MMNKGLNTITLDTLYASGIQLAEEQCTFEELINYCKTDITIVDFTKAKPAIEYLVPQSSKLTLKAFVSKSVKEIPDEE